LYRIVAIPKDGTEGKKLRKQLERIKWLLWHGNQHRAQQETSNLREDVASLELNYQHLKRFRRTAHEFAVYINNNSGSLINYGERYRSGERISSAMAESTVNALVSKRFAKRQQMQWTKRRAHLLLQTRTRTLDGTLRPLFERWYPGLTVTTPSTQIRHSPPETPQFLMLPIYSNYGCTSNGPYTPD